MSINYYQVKTELSEGEIQKQILDYLRYTGIIAWRNQSGFIRLGGRFINLGTEGSPDIVGVLPTGQFLGIEVKRETGKLSKAQKKFLEKIRKNGGRVIVARSVEEVKESLGL